MQLEKQLSSQRNEIARIAGFLWQKGWSERNGGNISIDLTGHIRTEGLDISGCRFVHAKFPKTAAGRTFLVSGAGKFLRDLMHTAEQAACVIHVPDGATGYYILWGGAGDPQFRVTSEFNTHLAIHLSNASHRNGLRAVLHAHPNELIALSHHPLYGVDQAKLNAALWGMLPEVRVFVPKGLALVPYQLPGSPQLADKTLQALKRGNVVLWRKHGALAAGQTLTQAFDYLDVANKGAHIFLTCLQAGFQPEGLSGQEMDELEEKFIKPPNTQG